MGLADPHDPRAFTHFAKLRQDGSVAAIVEVADTALAHHAPERDGALYVDITHLRREKIVVDALTVDPVFVRAAILSPEKRPLIADVFRATALKRTPSPAVVAALQPIADVVGLDDVAIK